MARSLKSKRRKKLNAIKRERYGKKELARLKKMLGLPVDEAKTVAGVVKAPDISEIAKVANFTEVSSFQQAPDDNNVEVVDSGDTVEAIVNLKEVSNIQRAPDNDTADNDVVLDDTVEARKKRTHKIRKSYKPNIRVKDLKNTKTIPAVADQMEHDQQRVFNVETFKDQYGNYPVWMNQKIVQKLSKEHKKAKRLAKKKKAKYYRGKGRRDHGEHVTDKEVSGLVKAIQCLKK